MALLAGFVRVTTYLAVVLLAPAVMLEAMCGWPAYTVIVGSGVKNEVAYKSAKAIHQNKKSLIAAHGVFRGYKPKLIAKKGLGVNFHPGAAKYYKEAGLL